jgi:G3E family GTPase
MACRVLALAGLRGSGKSSLALALGRAWTGGGRVAVLGNEAPGAVGPEALREAGLSVSEILGGCICCSLSGDLRLAAQRLLAEQDPGLLIIEAAGTAGPGSLREALASLPGYAPAQVLGVVDARRIEALDDGNPAYLDGLAAGADVLALNRADGSTLAAARRRLRGHAKVLPVDDAAAGLWRALGAASLRLAC